MSMTATIKNENRFSIIPKNKTGLFAADTLSDAKSNRHYLMNIPNLSAQFRSNGSINNILASSEQTQHQLQQFLSSNREIQQFYPVESRSPSRIDTSNSSRIQQSRIRNGFCSAKVQHRNFRFLTATNENSVRINESKSSSKQRTFIASQGSVRLKSEIDLINSQLKRHKDPQKQRNGNFREVDPNLNSALSFATTCRISSASTNFPVDRTRQRFTSAMTTNGPTEIVEFPSTPPANSVHFLPVTPAMTLNEPAQTNGENDENFPTHAYQIPQQSNVGSETIFTHSPPVSRASSSSTRFGRSKSASCPFYVMYLSNLAAQQRQSPKDVQPNEIQQVPITNLSTIKKVPSNSRSSASNLGQMSVRRPVNSPLSINTYSTNDEDEYLTAASFSTMQKRSSARTSHADRDNQSHLNEILRTSSWHPVHA